jgi:hypothetical protein
LGWNTTGAQQEGVAFPPSDHIQEWKQLEAVLTRWPGRRAELLELVLKKEPEYEGGLDEWELSTMAMEMNLKKDENLHCIIE